MVDENLLARLPQVKRIDIDFENITFTVPNGRKGQKQILRGVSGTLKSGELTAIMGPSGAGKSSLLNILTGFQTKGMTGNIKFNGVQRAKQSSSKFKKNSCYILQDDQLMPLFTVEETMKMAADLKLGDNNSREDKHKIIDDILDSLALTTCKKTRCGAISGGQKKRLSIALELIDNPPIMFLDEPTTGLDSSSSLLCIKTLKSLARDGRTIICTVHQPSATMYELFDHVYVLAQGHCIFQGDSVNTVAFLSSEGLQCPQYHNPADFLLEVAAGDYGNYTDILSRAAKTLSWRSLTQKFESNDDDQIKRISFQSVDQFNPPSEFPRFCILLKRVFIQIYRDWTVTQLKLLAHIAVGIFLGCLYQDFGSDGSKTIWNMGYFLVTLVYLCYTSMMPAVLKFPSELPVLRKERFNNWYKLKTYFASYLVASIPMQILFAFSYSASSYFLTNQPWELNRFLMFFSVTSLTTLCAESFGILLGTLVNPVNGTFLGAITLAVMLVVSGFLIFYSHMSGPMRYLTYLSYLAYGFEALVRTVYTDREMLECPDSELYCHYRAPATLLKEIGIDGGNYWLDVIAIFCYFLFFKVASFFTLRHKLSTG